MTSDLLGDDASNGRDIAVRGDADQLRHRIEQDLRAERWQPGERMPTERAFSERYGVARNTVRRALQALEADKLLTRSVGRGTFRAVPVTPAAGAGSDALTMDAALLSPSDVVECRLLFEPEMAPLAVARATSAELKQMAQCLEAAEAALDIPEFERWDAALHDLIAEATHNQSIVAIARSLAQVRLNAEWGQLKQRSMTPLHRSAIEQQHRAIVHALHDRDRERARGEMREHILYVRCYMFGE